MTWAGLFIMVIRATRAIRFYITLLLQLLQHTAYLN